MEQTGRRCCQGQCAMLRYEDDSAAISVVCLAAMPSSVVVRCRQAGCARLSVAVIQAGEEVTTRSRARGPRSSQLSDLHLLVFAALVVILPPMEGSTPAHLNHLPVATKQY